MSDKPTIVLVHGAWADGSSWNAVVDRAAEPGLHGSDPAEPAARPHRRRGVHRVVPRSAHHGPVVLVGHSYGGADHHAGAGRRGRARRSSTSTPSSRTRARRSSRSSAVPVLRSTCPIRRPCWTSPAIRGRRRATRRHSSSRTRCTRRSPRTCPRPTVAHRGEPAAHHPLGQHDPGRARRLEEHPELGGRSAPTTRRFRPRPSASWPSAPARRSARSTRRTSRWCRTRRRRSTRSWRRSPRWTDPRTGMRTAVRLRPGRPCPPARRRRSSRTTGIDSVNCAARCSPSGVPLNSRASSWLRARAGGVTGSGVSTISTRVRGSDVAL